MIKRRPKRLNILKPVADLIGGDVDDLPLNNWMTRTRAKTDLMQVFSTPEDYRTVRGRRRSSRASSRNIGRSPPFQWLRLDACFPAPVRGPVDCFHGCQRRIARACAARLSGVQPFAMIVLQ